MYLHVYTYKTLMLRKIRTYSASIEDINDSYVDAHKLITSSYFSTIGWF